MSPEARGMLRKVVTPVVLAREGPLWVLDKPAGFASHRTGDPSVPDVVSWAMEHAGAPPELAPIHRLDRETSGLLLCSDDPALRARLGALFATGEVKKTYRALVHGRTHKKGIVRRPLLDRRRGRPVAALTRWRRIASYGRVTLLEVRPETGRAHQIRRHLQGIGHPIVGDERYPPKRFLAVGGFPGRLWLHATALEFEGRRYEAPLPPELEAHLALLEAKLAATA